MWGQDHRTTCRTVALWQQHLSSHPLATLLYPIHRPAAVISSTWSRDSGVVWLEDCGSVGITCLRFLLYHAHVKRAQHCHILSRCWRWWWFCCCCSLPAQRPVIPALSHRVTIPIPIPIGSSIPNPQLSPTVRSCPSSQAASYYTLPAS